MDAEPRSSVDGTVYVFVIEFVILLLLFVGIITLDGRFPVLPSAVAAALTGSLVCAIIGLIATRLDLQSRRQVFAGIHPGALILSVLQVGIDFAFCALANFAMTVVVVLSYKGDDASIFFATAFLGDVKQSQQWYLTHAGVVFLLAFVFVLATLSFACFVKIRSAIVGKEFRRAHFVGLVGAFVFFNIGTQFLMQASKSRVCAEQGEESCLLTKYSPPVEPEITNYYGVIVIWAVVFVLDVLAEVGFDNMLQHYYIRPQGTGIVFLIMYIVSRLCLVVGVVLFYIDVGGYACTEVYPLWLRLVHAGLYTGAVILEASIGILEAASAPAQRAAGRQAPSDQINAFDKVQQDLGFGVPSNLLANQQRQSFGTSSRAVNPTLYLSRRSGVKKDK